jgi:uncharacterized Zn-binding protein involved in type VI secretion
MPGIARVGDKARAQSDSHGCPACPHTVIGPAVSGSCTVMINNKPALRLGDKGVHASCCGSNTWEVTGSSRSVLIDGLPAARIGDATHHCGAIGTLVEASPDIICGD